MFLVKNFILQVLVLASCFTRVQQFGNYASFAKELTFAVDLLLGHNGRWTVLMYLLL
jgi:hypothetical protein